MDKITKYTEDTEEAPIFDAWDSGYKKGYEEGGKHGKSKKME